MIVTQSRVGCDVVWPEKLTRDGQTIFVKTDLIKDFFKQVLIGPFSFRMVTGESDFSPTTFFPDDILHTLLDNPLLIEWRAQNLLFSHPKLTHFPIGVQTCNLEFCQENQERLRSLPKKDDVYYNFDIDNNVQERIHFSKGPAIRKDFETYMREMASYKYVMCPMGNGVDTHRFWEAQVCGCIPIIRCPEEFLPTYEGFPYISLPGICYVRLGWPDLIIQKMSTFKIKL